MSEDYQGASQAASSPSQGVLGAAEIQSLIDAKVKEILSAGGNYQEPAKELTSEEKVQAALDTAHHQLARDTAGQGPTVRMYSLLAAIEALFAHVKNGSAQAPKVVSAPANQE